MDSAGDGSATGQTRGPLRHEDAVLEVEVRRVMHALAPYGVLRQDALAKACGARRWRAGEFRDALEAAVRDGRLRRLPLGFYARRAAPPADPR